MIHTTLDFVGKPYWIAPCVARSIYDSNRMDRVLANCCRPAAARFQKSIFFGFFATMKIHQKKMRRYSSRVDFLPTFYVHVVEPPTSNRRSSFLVWTSHQSLCLTIFCFLSSSSFHIIKQPVGTTANKILFHPIHPSQNTTMTTKPQEQQDKPLATMTSAAVPVPANISVSASPTASSAPIALPTRMVLSAISGMGAATICHPLGTS